MENHNYCVYIHINKINGKKYVGITCKDPKKRWNNGYGYYRNKHFFSAIKKYGWDLFEHKILFQGLTAEEAGEKEKELIAYYKSNFSEFGYNICNGGETNILPKKSLEKISKANKGKKRTKEQLLKRSQNPPKARAVICEDKEFISIAECAKYYNISASDMRAWLSGDKYIPYIFVEKKLRYADKAVEYVTHLDCRAKVICEDKTFFSIVECAQYYSINVATLKNWLYGYTKMPEDFVLKNLHKEPNIKYKIKK